MSGYEHGHAPPGGTGNARNGRPPKTVLTDHGAVRMRARRATATGRFEPQIVGKRQTRWIGFDEKVIALYARGHDDPRHPGPSRRDLRHRRQPGHDLQNHRCRPRRRQGVADAAAGRRLRGRLPRRPRREGPRWRRSETTPATWRSASTSTASATFSACGFSSTEGAKFWLQVLTELRQRGVQDVLVCCVDGLTGFPDAIEAVFPQAWVQTCIVHLVRSSLRFVPYKDRQRRRRGSQAHLHRRRPGRRGRRADRFQREVGSALPDDQPILASSAGSTSRHFSRSPRICAASSTRPTRSRRSTARSARSSRPAGTSRPRTPPASSSTSRSRAPRRSGATPTAGTPRSPP